MKYLLLIASVLLGALLVLLLKPSNKTVRLLLAFSGAYLLSVAILHLLPEVYNDSTNKNIIGICILAGVILQSVLESFSKGAEHGHIHIHTNGKTFPRLLFVSLSIHAFSEGLPIYHYGENLLWAIIVHKIPIAIILTLFLLNSNFSKKTIGFFLTIFALMSPLGVLISNKIIFFELYSSEITAIVIGIFLHISTIILFESSENHNFNLHRFLVIISGILLTVFTL
tara:strand:+ start:1954 stop:2631 length:678 start_codon:yes stop_codon:yes gene_type:complete